MSRGTCHAVSKKIYFIPSDDVKFIFYMVDLGSRNILFLIEYFKFIESQTHFKPDQQVFVRPHWLENVMGKDK